MSDYIQGLSQAVSRVYSSMGVALDPTRKSDALSQVNSSSDPQKDLSSFMEALGEGILIRRLEEPDPGFMPFVTFSSSKGWGAVMGRMPDGRWLFEGQDGEVQLSAEELGSANFHITPRAKSEENLSFKQLIKENLYKFKGVILEAILASVLINFFALAVSLFSMQVYDRVIPTQSGYTLAILATGVLLVIVIEMGMKFARSKIMDQVVVGVDNRLSRAVFQRLLNVRVDQLPGSVGTMAAQLRGYEQVRNFYTATTLFTLVDLPMGILFLVVIAVIGSPLVALVPLIASVVALLVGLYTRKEVDRLAAEGAEASYRKTGILVEAVEGVETIKAGSGNWRFLSRWLDVLGITVGNDLDMRRSNDYMSFFSQSLQQGSYVGIVIVGAFVVMTGDMTMGALIACSILGGRVLNPVMQIPNLMVQAAHAKAAEKNIEQLFALQMDNHGVDRPLAPSSLRGHFHLNEVRFNYGENKRPAVSIDALNIKPGERVGVLGPIGSGKSTLLRLLSGLYAPTAGRVLIDGLDIQQISRETLSQQVGYLQQDHRLFQGTLRENLLIGMADPGDQVIKEAIEKTGLINLVASHSSGLDLPISEGGKGLSGGQRQLVAFTRILLTNPRVMLLDEPTASMDDRQEARCIEVLKEQLEDHQTLVMSTHKMPLLQLVDRLIIMVGNKVVMDGPKEAVLAKLQGDGSINPPAQAAQAKAAQPTVKAANYSGGQISATINKP